MTLTYDAFREAVEDDDRRRALLFADGRPRFVLFAQQFSRVDLERLFRGATAIRELHANREGAKFLRTVLEGRRVLNLFAQPSTRTNESFAAAADTLGATVRVIGDLETTSFAKGETVEDAVRTLACNFDLLICRHGDEDFATRAAWAMSRWSPVMPVISAGSGRAEHPTQALIDGYTLSHRFAGRGGLEGRRVLLVGDIGRNRAARSLALLMTRFDLRKLDVACVPGHGPDPALLDALRKARVEVTLHDTLPAALDAVGKQLDAIYVTRLQQEWDAAGELGTHEDFVLRWDLRDRIRPDCAILHPLPRVNELPEAWDDHPGCLIWQQVRNGRWVRAALVADVFGALDRILDRY